MGFSWVSRGFLVGITWVFGGSHVGVTWVTIALYIICVVLKVTKDPFLNDMRANMQGVNTHWHPKFES